MFNTSYYNAGSHTNNIKINDAVIATINGDVNKTSLATNQKTLRANNCKIVVLK